MTCFAFVPRLAVTLFFASLLLTASLGLRAQAVAPTLTADDPIELDAENQVLLARGAATFVHQDFELVADEIRFFRRENRAEAIGNVRLIRGEYRILAERAEYRVASRSFVVENFRGGTPPGYVEGRRAEGSPDSFQVTEATVYYGEPDYFSPRLTAASVSWQRDQGIDASRATLHAGPVPIFWLPRVVAPIDRPGFDFDGALGYRSNLGAFAEAGVLFPVAPNLALGPRLGLYSQRGWLIGPRLSLFPNASRPDFPTLELDAGYINDHGPKGFDTRGLPVPEDRGYLDLSYRQAFTDRLSLAGTLTYWSDSAVDRDFRRDLFRDRQEPDTWAEMLYAGEGWYLSAFTRLHPNSFQIIQERLPEVRFDLPPTALGDTGAYFEAQASAARLRQDAVFPLSLVDRNSDRVDALAIVRYPWKAAPNVTVTPVIGGRATHYEDALGGSFTRTAGQVGFDLESAWHRTYDLAAPAWGIDGLRHVIRPVLRHRWQPGTSSGAARIPVIDDRLFVTGLPAIDLADVRFLDRMDDDHRLRFGLEQSWLTRDRQGGWRELASAGVHQDLVLGRASADAWEATYLRFSAAPTRWLAVDFYQAFATEGLAARETRLRLAVKDADFWEVAFYSDFLKGVVEQYGVEYRWNVTRSWGVRAVWRYDADLGSWTEQRYGVVQRLGHAWEVAWEVVLRQGSTREDDTAFRVSIDLLRF